MGGARLPAGPSGARGPRPEASSADTALGGRGGQAVRPFDGTGLGQYTAGLYCATAGVFLAWHRLVSTALASDTLDLDCCRIPDRPAL